MDDRGVLRAHAEGSVGAQATARADLGSGTTSATVTQSPPRPAPLAKIAALTLTAAGQPHGGSCGTALRLTGTVTVDGPATVAYKFQADVGGVQFSDGPIGTVTLDAAGDATLVKDAVLPRSLEGRLRIQAIVQGTKGHNGPLKTSDPVPFKVTCAGK
jgi:hypothetical protein